MKKSNILLLLFIITLTMFSCTKEVLIQNKSGEDYYILFVEGDKDKINNVDTSTSIAEFSSSEKDLLKNGKDITYEYDEKGFYFYYSTNSSDNAPHHQFGYLVRDEAYILTGDGDITRY